MKQRVSNIAGIVFAAALHLHSFAGGYAVVQTQSVADDIEWHAVAQRLLEKHSSTNLLSFGGHLKESLRALAPERVAFVMKPAEATNENFMHLHELMRQLNADPYDDAMWGIVTAPSAKDAMRIASATNKTSLVGALTTTGLDRAKIAGDVLTICDAHPNCIEKRISGVETKEIVDGDHSGLFADFWNSHEPEFVFTSGHASDRNLEMSFSTGNIVSKGGRLYTQPNASLIDYMTGQYLKGRIRHAKPLAAGTKPKVWLAAGNCLLGKNSGGESMIMALLGEGMVDQFVGYTDVTWFGAVGWGTAGYFTSGGKSLVEAYFLAHHDNLEKLYSASEDERTKAGRIWDSVNTIFYGDPGVDIYLCGIGTPAQSASAQ
ncbi:MAG: hypothetical protein IJ802_02625 [Kiritimatiellae bacterium]|nr:hypothetical protein [Kiritimatiellia bacterium]